MQKIKKLAIIVGHTKKDGGSVMAHGGMSEYDYNLKVAINMQLMQGAYGIRTQVITRDGIWLRGAYAKAVFFGADVIVELHFNSDESKDAQGSLVLVSEDYEDHPFAKILQKNMLALFGGKDRGIVVPEKEDRGYTNINRPTPYFLLEPFFGSNVDQCKFALDNIIKYAATIHDAVMEFNEEHT
jgi:N-acetylmuramoyl-L-alanine amidase